MNHKKSNSRWPVIDIDTGKIRMGLGTFASIVLFVISVAVGVVTFGVNMATRSDVENGLENHSKTPHYDEKGNLISAPIAIVSRVEANEQNTKILKSKMDGIERKVDLATKGQQYLRARIDFLIEQRIIEANRDPEGKSVIRAAARRIRNRAKKANLQDDPLGGLPGL